MGEYRPPFTITNKMLSYVSSISEKIGRISVIGNLESKPHLRKNNRIKSIHSSLKIEANSLTLGQVRDVINGKAVLGEQKEIQEVKNAYTAYEHLVEINPYDIRHLKKFHGIMTKYLVEESGEFRSGEEGVFNGDQCIFMAPPARFVPQLMNDLFAWMKEARKDVHPLILSSVFHYEFVFIHPFADDNGRMARLWHTAILSNGNRYLNIFRLRAGLKNFRTNIMMLLLSAMLQENQQFLLNLCYLRLIRFLMIFLFRLTGKMNIFLKRYKNCLRLWNMRFLTPAMLLWRSSD